MPSQGSKFTETDIPDLTGYVIIVTGGNSGIGYETTKQLALRNARVYIASRSKERVDQAIDQMAKSCGKKLDIKFLQIDLQDLKSVKAAAAAFMQQESRLDILINNAGVMAVPFKLTVDGFETQWQVNYLAPHIFTTCLLPLLLSTASLSGNLNQVRVVNVASDMAFFGPKTLQFDDVNMKNIKGMMQLLQRYGHSKQASIRDAKELNDRYSAKGVTAYSLHPGVVRSNLQNSDPSMFGRVLRLTMKLTPNSTPLQGALNSLFCATSPTALKGMGRFFIPVGKADPKADAWINDTKSNAKLWEDSETQMARLM